MLSASRPVRSWRPAALFAALLLVGAACAPPPTPNATLVVTTTADTFDGVCDADCSLRDAIAASNALALVAGQPNQISVPAGTYTLAATAPIAILKQVIITGAGAATTTLDISSSTVAAPGGVFGPSVPLVINGLSVVSNNVPAADVLASCGTSGPRAVSLFNVAATGLAATTSACDTTVVNSTITGPATVLEPFALAVTNSVVPFGSATISPARITLVSATVTGPSATDGSTQNATVSIQPAGGALNVPVSITTSRFVGVGLQLGGAAPGSINANVLSTSFGMTGPNGPVSLTVGEGSTARILNSTVYGGGAAGALRALGTLSAESVTATTNGPAITVGATGTANVRRSVLSGAGGTCSGTINSLGRNAVVGASCGTPAATDLTVADEAALQLGILDLWGNPTPSLHRQPLPGSPLLDAIPPGPVTDLDCPTDATGGRSIDARGVLRPQGTGCDIGALEVQVTPPPG